MGAVTKLMRIVGSLTKERLFQLVGARRSEIVNPSEPKNPYTALFRMEANGDVKILSPMICELLWVELCDDILGNGLGHENNVAFGDRFAVFVGRRLEFAGTYRTRTVTLELNQAQDGLTTAPYGAEVPLSFPAANVIYARTRQEFRELVFDLPLASEVTEANHTVVIAPAKFPCIDIADARDRYFQVTINRNHTINWTQWVDFLESLEAHNTQHGRPTPKVKVYTFTTEKIFDSHGPSKIQGLKPAKPLPEGVDPTIANKLEFLATFDQFQMCYDSAVADVAERFADVAMD